MDLENLLLIDALAEGKGHLINDDLFLAECLSPLVKRLEVRSSPESVKRIREQLGLPAQPFKIPKISSHFIRMQYILKLLSLRVLNFEHILLQSFEEVSTLLLMLRHPKKYFHLVVTNNLAVDRFHRWPTLHRFFLGNVFLRAATIFVHCQFEADLVRRFFPSEADKVVVIPFHQIGFDRSMKTRKQRDNTILFVGPVQSHKGLGPIIDLIKKDKSKRFRYCFSSMGPLDRRTQEYLSRQENVYVVYGYEEDDVFYTRIGSALYVFLTHDEVYRGRLSGILCDALACLTPVISDKIEPAAEFFQDFGNMGFLENFRDSFWPDRFLEQEDPIKYNEFQKNIMAIKKACGIGPIRDIFRTTLARTV